MPEKKMAREVLIDFLKANGRTTFAEVEQVLYGSGCLGFGVQPIDVVQAAVRSGWIYYNPQIQTVTLRKRGGWK